MNEEILELAKEQHYQDGYFFSVCDLEAFYRAAYNKAIEDALYISPSVKCYDAINELKK